MRRLFGIISLCTLVWANSSAALTLPGQPTGGFGDEIRSFDGTTCKNGNSGPIVDLGFAHESNSITSSVDTDAADNTMYARVVIPLGRSKSVDCNLLYQMELERLRLELQMLKDEQEDRVNRNSIFIR